MAVSGLISILMRADTRPLARGSKDAHAMLSRLSSQMRLLNAVTVGGAAFNALNSGARAASGFVSQIVNAASDLNEQMSATGATFGGASSQVVKAAEEQARAFGVVKSEYLESANGLGAIFKASGLSEQAAAQMSVQFTNLATDLSSFRNLDFPDALNKIRSGLVGEAEPLRTVGVLLSEGAVKAEAYRAGIARTGAELTEAQKVQARAAIIARQLSDANGDLARTATGPANAMRAIQGRSINMAADFGRAIEPITKSILGGVNLALADMSGFLDSNTSSIAEWAAQSVKSGGLVNNAIKTVGTLAGGAADLVTILGKAASGMFNMLLQGLAKIPFIGSKFTAMADEFSAMNSKFQAMEAPGQRIAKTFDSIAEKTSKFSDAAQGGSTGLKKSTDQAQELMTEVQALNQQLDEQKKFFGMDSQAVQLQKLAERGAGGAQLKELADKMANNQLQEVMADRRKSIADAQADRLKSPFAGLATAGSREMFSLDLRARTGMGSNDPATQTAKNTDKLVNLIGNLNKILTSKGAPSVELAMVN